jgi:hypothetical protein
MPEFHLRNCVGALRALRTESPIAVTHARARRW